MWVDRRYVRRFLPVFLLAGLLSHELSHEQARAQNDAQQGGGNAAAADGRVPRERLQQVPLRVQNLPPALEQILRNWSNATAKITELQGEHQRFVYDTTFETEKRATGKFYYKAPDKGRIDLTPVAVPRDSRSEKTNDKGEPYTIVADQPEKWVADGQRILQIDEQERQVTIFPIPQEKQGRNIMDGPLPFLFGMPPDMAKQRFELALLKDDPNHCWIQARPRWQSDALNYREARIILDKRTWLPVAVQLIDPAETKQTVYKFINLKQPGGGFLPLHRLFPERDPFEIDLRRYQIINRDVEQAGDPVPSFRGMTAGDAKAAAEQAGFVPEFRRGRPARQEGAVHTIYAQSPPDGTPVRRGGKVILVYFDEVQAAAETPRR